MGVIHSAITWRRGAYHEEENTPGVLSRIYYLTVPKGQVWEIDALRPFMFRFLAKEIGLTPSGQTVTVQHPVFFPVEPGGVQAPVTRYTVAVGTVGGNKQRLTITEVEGKNITFAETVDDGTKVDVFYIPDVAALLQFRVEDPRNIVELSETWLQEDPRLIMALDPADKRTKYNLNLGHLLPEDYIFSIYLKAPYTIAWEDTLGNPLPVVLFVPIIIHPIEDLGIYTVAAEMEGAS